MNAVMRPRWLALVCWTLCTGPLARTAPAADPAFVGVLSVVMEDDVAKQLGLSEETKGKLRTLVNRREDEAIPRALAVKDLPPAEQAAQLASFVQESERLGLALLSEEQRQKLERIRIARAGLSTVSEPEVAKQLQLTDEQKAKLAALLTARTAALATGSAVQRRSARDEYERQLAALLTPAQRAAWEALANPAESPTPAPPAADQVSPGAAPMPAAPGTTPGADSAATVKPGTPPATGPDRPAAPATGGGLRFNFRFAPWQEVLDWFAQQADLSLVLDAPPAGTFNYTDTRTYTPAEAIDLLNSVLLTKGFTLVRRDRMVLLINLEDGIPPNLVTRVPLEDLDKRGEFELVSCLFSISRLAPEEAEKELGKLLGPQGAIVVLPRSRQVLVTETAGRLRTIRAVIEGVENPAAHQDQTVRVFDLKTLLASEVLLIVRPLLGMPADKNEIPDGSLRIATDPLESRLFVSGKPDQVTRLEEILKLIDVEGGAAGPGGVVETPQLEIYPVEVADPTAVLQVMQTLLAGLPDVRLATDPATGNLVALARPAQHATIKATLAQMQQDAKQVEVVQLRRIDPQAAVVAINKLFAGSTDDKTGKSRNAPLVEADPTTGQLMIRGSEAQLVQIRALLQKLGEDATPVTAAAADGGNVRVLPFGGRMARDALEQIQSLWPTVRQNRIRVVTPSAVVPALERRVPLLDLPRTGQPPWPAEDERGPAATMPPRTVPPPTAPPPSAPPPSAAPPTVPPPTAPPPSAPPSAASPPAAASPTVPPPKTAADDDAAFGARIRFVSEPRLAAAGDSPPAAPSGSPPVAGGAPTSAAQQALAEIVVAPGPGGIVIASEDTAALDEFEQLFRLIIDQRRLGPAEPTVFYLRYARADVAAELLQQVLSGESSGGSEGGGSLLGDIAKTALGDVGGGLVGGLLGLGGGAAGSSASSGPSNVQITPDTRLNALIVQASPLELDLIEQLLKIIDQEASPEPVQTVGRPRLIPVLHTSAEQVAAVVRQVYANRLASGGDAQRQPSPEDLIRALRGGGGRGGSSKSRAAEDQQKMTLGVDPRSNSLVVSAPEPLFLEVQALVEQLDQADAEAEETVALVDVKGANPDLVQRALSSIMGGAVSRARGVPATSSTPGTVAPPPRLPSSDEIRDQIRRRLEMFQSLQGGRSSGSSGYRSRSGR